MSIENGNFDLLRDKSPENRGWVVGNYVESGTLRNSNTVEVKWPKHKKGLKKSSGSDLDYNVKTLVILVSGRWRQIFPSESKEVILSKLGDYVIYSGQEHEAEALDETRLCVIRWKESSTFGEK